MRPTSSSRGLLLCVASLLFLISAEPPRPETVDSPTLMLTFAGDVMHHALTAGMSDYDLLYESVRALLTRDDLSFANIEFPVDPAREPSGYPLFNGTETYVRAAVRAGFDVFSLANNHSFDGGSAAVASTAELFSQLALDSGTYHNGLRVASPTAIAMIPVSPEASGATTALPGNAPIGPTLIRHNGWTVGFVAITAFSNTGGASRYVNVVDYTSPARREWFLSRVAEWKHGVDLLVVSIHAGVEYQTVPDEEKARFYRDVAAAGADVVWGHHPHVLQPWELVHGDDHDSLILYSTGNFVSAQRRRQAPEVPMGMWAPTGDTALYQVVVRRDSAGVTFDAVRTPMFTMIAEPGGLVLRTFDDVLSRQLPVQWRAFYLARFAALTRLVRPLPGEVAGGG